MRIWNESPNAPDTLSTSRGIVRFPHAHPKVGRISEDIPDDTAAWFARSFGMKPWAEAVPADPGLPVDTESAWRTLFADYPGIENKARQLGLLPRVGDIVTPVIPAPVPETPPAQEETPTVPTMTPAEAHELIRPVETPAQPVLADLDGEPVELPPDTASALDAVAKVALPPAAEPAPPAPPVTQEPDKDKILADLRATPDKDLLSLTLADLRIVGDELGVYGNVKGVLAKKIIQARAKRAQ